MLRTKLGLKEEVTFTYFREQKPIKNKFVAPTVIVMELVHLSSSEYDVRVLFQKVHRLRRAMLSSRVFFVKGDETVLRNWFFSFGPRPRGFRFRVS